jgi:hypothetical protein
MPLTNYEIISYVGVGELRFGMSQQQVHELLGNPSYTSQDDFAIYESYDQEGLMIHYQLAEKTCMVIAIGPPTMPTFRGASLMYVPWESVAPWLNSIDSNVEEIDVGLIGKDIGINLCHEELENNDGDLLDVVNTVLAFQKGYWEMEIGPYQLDPEIDAINSEEDFDAWFEATMAAD